jgi:RNA polymerase sigma-70 factor (ECF subfamily)
MPTGGSLLSVAFAPDEAADPVASLFARLEPRLRALASRYVRDPDASADVVQNAFEKVLRHLASFRGDANLSTWIHRIVVNEALMWLRSERRRRARLTPNEPEPLAAVPDAIPLACEQLERDEARRRVRCALERLRPIDRAVLEGTVLADATTSSYARSAGIGPAVAKSRAYRARQELRRLLST